MLATVASFTSCNKGDEPEPEPTKPAFKVIKDRVIEISYDTFDLDENASFFNKYLPKDEGQTLAYEASSKEDALMGGCSAIRVNIGGKWYVGRDYDFYCSMAPAVIIRNNAGTYKTIGICNSPKSFDPWTSASTYTIKDDVLASAPFLCCDVMNDQGLYAETNIRPKEAALVCSHTNVGKPRRCTQTFMMTMLSQYKSIDEIKQHLNDYDWFDLQEMGFEQSFFITDQAGKSILIEFGANKVMYKEDTDCNANFFQNEELYKIEKIGCGEKRLEHEKAYLKEHGVNSEDDLFAMMKTGAYDQFYHTDVDPDFAVPEFYEVIGYNKDSYAKDPEGARKACMKKVEEFSKYTWEERVANKSWESTFITAANVTDLTLHVHFSEHYGIDFTVGF